MDAAANIATRYKTALHYRVGGMDCPSCAGKIETAVKRLGGIERIQVDYHSQILRLRLDEQVTSRTAVEGRIRSLGYEVAAAVAPTLSMGNVSSPDIPATTEQAWWRTRKIRPLLTIGSLLALGAMVEPFLPAIGGWTELPAAIVGLWSASRRAIALARAGSPFSIEMLMSVAAIGALFIGAPAEAAVVVFLFTAGEAMEGFAAGRARAGIQALSALVPRTALLIDGQEVRPVSADTVQVGQTVLVRPGDRVPVDGIVLEGASELDQSPITGESVLVAKQEGDTLLAGSINGSAALRVQTTRAASDNTIARIVRLVEEAQASRAPTARFIERFSTFYTPAVVLVALLTVLVPPLAFGAGWMTWTYRGLALLLIGCPCALVLSTPAAITSGLAAGARRGLLIKGGTALETVGRVRTVAFDKTGTLTRGEPTLTDVVALDGDKDSIASSASQERAVLSLAASVESGSSHPLAQAMLRRADADSVPLRPVRNAMAVPGHAALGIILGKSVVVGSPRYVATLVPLSRDVEQRISSLEEVGKTVVVVVLDGQLKGVAGFTGRAPGGCGGWAGRPATPGYTAHHADRRQPADRGRHRQNPGRRRVCGAPSRGQASADCDAEIDGPGGHGRRWHQRRTGVGRGVGRHCHGRCNRCRARDGGCGGARSTGRRDSGAGAPVAGHNAEYPPERRRGTRLKGRISRDHSGGHHRTMACHPGRHRGDRPGHHECAAATSASLTRILSAVIHIVSSETRP